MSDCHIYERKGPKCYRWWPDEHICSKCHSTVGCLPLNVTGHWGRVARPMQSEPSGPDTKTLWVGRGTRNTGVLGHATQTSKQCCNSMKNVSNSIAGALLSSSHVIVFGERLIMGVFGCKTSITISLRGFLLLVTESKRSPAAARRWRSMQLSLPLALSLLVTPISRGHSVSFAWMLMNNCIRRNHSGVALDKLEIHLLSYVLKCSNAVYL